MLYIFNFSIKLFILISDNYFISYDESVRIKYKGGKIS